MIFMPQRIARRALSDDFAQDEPVTVQYHPADVSIEGKFMVLSEDDERVKISCWGKFITKVGWN
jgi:hypothetical protein